MERLKEFNTISIKIPKKMMYRDRFGKWKAVPSMTGRGKISYRNGIPSVDIVALGDKVEIQSDGKNFEKKQRKLTKKNNINDAINDDNDELPEPTRKRKRLLGRGVNRSIKQIQDIKRIRDAHRFLV
jgi:hypothetical protein